MFSVTCLRPFNMKIIFQDDKNKVIGNAHIHVNSVTLPYVKVNITKTK